MSEVQDRIAKLSPKRLALLAVELQAKLEAVERQRTEPIAIIGMGCRVPAAEDPEAFWRLLRDGVDAIRAVPPDRWDADAYYDPDPDTPGRMSTRWGGFLEHVDRFDPLFFGIAPRDAVSMDPQHRLLLEVAWEALEDAGQAPPQLSGSRTGVFVGITSNEYGQRLGQAGLLDNYLLTGTALNFAAGRLSYVLGLQGPSLAVDTACSSSLVAVHLACQSLRGGECRMALAGGVNLILTPAGTVATSKARMLAPDGRCKTFDAAADGIGRGEGCGVVVLKRLSDALADGDRVLALVRGSAVNQDGSSGGLTVPNGLAQQALLREVLTRSGVKPAEVGYVEAHGTGTALGDPIEVRALAAVLGEGRNAERPVLIGSVKTNLGHLESAAGVVGLIKAVLALQHEEIPPHLHLENPTPHIDWHALPVVVPTSRTPWPAGSVRRIAGVSSFGFSGTNAHVVLEEAPVLEEKVEGLERPLHVLTVSAKTEGALHELVGRLARYLPEHPSLDLADVCFTANAGRGHFAHRLAVRAGSKEMLWHRLSEWVAGHDIEGMAQAHVPGTEHPKVAFLFTGQGSQYAGMGLGLYETQPTFRKALERCEEILRDQLERPLLSVVYPERGAEELLDETVYTQPALFALEWALFELWRSWGIEPSWVMGHSVGEYAAACAAGVFSLEDGLRLVAERGRLMEALPVRGVMAAAFASEERVAPALAAQGGSVSIAAVNGPENVVISGSAQDVGAMRVAFEARGVKTRPLAVSHAFHSPLMDRVREDFAQAAGKIAYATPRLGLVSNLTGRPAWTDVTEASYWSRHLREPVRFAAGMETLREQGCTAFVEIGPAATLLGMGRRCVSDGDRLWLPSLRRGRDDWSQLLESLGSLYVRGADVDWRGFDHGYPRRKVALPTYPFQRERYWVEAYQPPPAERASARTVSDLIYELSWPEKGRGRTGARPEGRGRWLILSDRGGVGASLARRLEELGERCERLFAGSAPPGEKGIGVDPADVGAAVRRLTEANDPWRGVVHLWGAEVQEPRLPLLQALQEAGVGSLLSLAQALVGAGARGTRLWVVTRGAQAVGGCEVFLPAAPLWGLGRVIALEHPTIWGGLVDLDPAGPAEANGLWEEVWAPDGEDQVALRGGARHVARLQRNRGLGEKVRLSGERSYLITGGLGALGLRVARWMVDQGARSLVLAGRRGPSGAAAAALRTLTEAGAVVKVVQADVARGEEVGRLFEQVDAEMPPLRGVIHAAGVLDDGMLLQQSWERFERVLAPKAMGAWNLHVHTAGRELDFFVLFSSAASLFGSSGQGNYTAANAFLDALAHYRRHAGLPAVSVNWGPWSGVGMAAALRGRDQQRWVEGGLGFITPEQGLAALERLLQHRAAQVGVLAVDWDRVMERESALRGATLLEGIDVPRPAKPPRKEDASAQERSVLRLQLAEADPAHRHEQLVVYLRRHVARVLGLSTPDLVEPGRPLNELGLDSLMATQLKNRVEADLEADVPLATLLTGPSVAELARLIDEARPARTPDEAAPLRPVPRDGELPLSFAQQRLWFLDQMEAGSAYSLSWAARVTGLLDATALEASLGEVVRRHEALRTVFPAVEGRPVQVVQPGPQLRLAKVDLGETPEADRARAARCWAAEEAERPFDLARGPLFRASLLRFGDDDHALVLTFHHIVADGWSVKVLVRELAVLYEAFTRGAPSPLPELHIQYADFARWQRDWLQGKVLDEQLSYWKHRLGDGLPVLELPTDRPRPAVQSYRGATHFVALPSGLAEEVRALSQRAGVTVFMTLLAALQALLHRHTGQDDVVIGFSIANRNRAELEGLIGFFVNNLVLRTDLSGDPSFRELQARVRDVALGAYDHQDLPFEKLVEELQPERDLGQNPIFQVILDVQSASRNELRLADLRLTPIETEVTVARFDLEIHLWESAEQLAAVFHYNTDLFEPATIERMAGHYQRLLEAVVERPERRLSELPLLTERELRQAVVEWNATGCEYPREKTISELFQEQAERSPEAVAVSFGGQSFSYRELDRRTNQLAHHLRRCGVGPEVRVGICVERSLEMVVGLLGILKAGGAYVPLDPSYPQERLEFMLEDSRVPVLLTQERMLEALPQQGARVLCLDRDWGTIAAESDADVASGAGGQNLAYVIYTSGSTGQPKGVAVPHCAVNRLLINTDYVQVQPSDRIAQASNASFDAATFEIWGALLSGARLVGIRREVALSPHDLAAELRRSEVTILFLTTALFNQMAGEDVGAFSSLRHLLFGGEAVDPVSVREVLKGGPPARLLHVYGPTESTTFATWHLVEEVAEGEATVPIGRPIANTRVYVLDRAFNPVPSGVPGELYIGGDGLARGYLGRPDLTAEKFVPDPFSAEGGGRLYRTGDLVRCRPNGAIEFLGRLDSQVKLRGFRVELGEIESVLRQHPRVKDTVVVAREDHPGDKRLVAYVVSSSAEAVTTAPLRAHLKQRLPEYMVPSAFVLLEALPLNPNGKVDRRLLPAPDGSLDAGTSYEAPRSEVERRIAAVWKEVLRLGRVGVRDNFFDLGGHSLLLLQVHVRLREAFAGRKLSVVDLFRYPTVESLAEHLAERGDGFGSRVGERARRRRGGTSAGIAVIATAGRFPGAWGVEEFWRNLRGGVESISFFTDEELAVLGVPRELLRDGKYVKARGVLEGVELFDAGFFGYNPREAELMDPQQRVFLETAWEALEGAGYDAQRYEGLIGVYAGVGANSYWRHLSAKPELLSAVGEFAALIGSDKDFLPTRVSYKLNLRGPSVAVQTACSTSLVAVHLACQGLLGHECDMALAGGVSIGLPQKTGYRYQEEGIMSPDGHCRAFDAKARGTVVGSGVGVVVLKRLEEALRDGDTIDAVIKGSAINNDGGEKVGYTAPGVSGQAEVIALAQAVAGVEPETIGYVEAHGTGTTLGDPIEVEALGQVFRGQTEKKGFCALGSLKTNVGHLDTAAGVAGLIKTVLALRHRELPPSLHYEEPNPKIDLVNSPFFVNDRLRPWTSDGARRAGVSSFGIGGTNAHVVLEEAPEREPSDPSRPWQVLVVSAKSEAAAAEAARRLGEQLKEHPEQELADVSYTLQVGRRAFSHRKALVCRDAEDARDVLGRGDSRRVLAGVVEETGVTEVAFVFPGQGTQYVGMCAGIYGREEVFRGELDRCAQLLRPVLGLDLREVLYPEEGGEAEAATRLGQTAVAQPALFVVEYALARLWMSWGVKPEAMLGHSVGEYVAACLAGVFSLEDALGLVAERGRLMQQMPTGAMLAVTLAEHEVAALLDGALGLAAVNGPSQCVVSGPVGSVEELQGDLSARGVETQRLRTSHAFHSVLMEPVLSAFAERVGAVERHPPRIPYVSNLTGTWVTDEEAVDPGYWARHLRETVRFGAGLGEVLRESRRVLLEVGPGQTLCGLARQQTEWGPERVAVASARYARQSTSDEEVLLQAAGRLWLAGVDVDWTALHAGERRRRVPLPTYPFERKRYWIDASAQPLASNIPDASHITTKKPDIADWFYRPTWRSSVRPREEERRLAEDGSCWLLFADECGLGARLAQRLEQKGRRVVQVAPGPGFARREESAFVIRPEGAADYEAVLRELRAEGAVPDRIVHLWSVTRRAPAPSLERSQDLGFYSLMFLAQALGSQHAGREVSLTVVTSGMQEVSGEGLAHPEKATVLGLCRVIPQEYPKVSCRSVDVVTPETGSWRDEEIEALLADCGEGRAEPVVAYRRGERWVQDFQAARLQRGEGTVRLREGGVYLITGGLGGIGLELARYLAEAVRARLVLVSRTGLPPREEWDSWLGSHGEADGTSRKIRKVQALEGRGAEVLVLSADASDRQQMGEALARAEARFGEMHGVIHSAGVAPGGVIQLKSREMAERVLAPKVGGTLVLEELLAERQPDFVVLCSSLASVLGVPGQADYCAANAFQDAFARRCAGSGGPFVLSLNWDTWGETGMAVESEVPAGLREHLQARLPTGEGILSAEGTEAFARALAQALPQLVVSTVELAPRIAHFRSLGSEETLVGEAPGEPASRHPRPELTTAYAAPRDEVEQTIAEVWQELLGFERVGVNDNFFDLGGHSLLLIQVHRRLKALFPERELSVVELFTHSTIAALAAHLSAAPGQSVAVRADEVEADARMREAGRERLARRRGVRTGLSRAEGADA